MIIWATRAGEYLGVLAVKSSDLRKKIVIICIARAEAKLCDLAFKMYILRQILVIVYRSLAGPNLGV